MTIDGWLTPHEVVSKLIHRSAVHRAFASQAYLRVGGVDVLNG
ncbi:hypothetical protein [Nocardia brasiliensis]